MAQYQHRRVSQKALARNENVARVHYGWRQQEQNTGKREDATSNPQILPCSNVNPLRQWNNQGQCGKTRSSPLCWTQNLTYTFPGPASPSIALPHRHAIRTDTPRKNMAPITAFDASIDIHLRCLRSLKAFLTKASSHAAAATLPSAKAPNDTALLILHTQSCTSLATRGLALLTRSEQEAPVWTTEEATLERLIAHVDKNHRPALGGGRQDEACLSRRCRGQGASSDVR